MTLQVNDRVRIKHEPGASISGPSAPTSFGTQARGTLLDMETLPGGHLTLGQVRWDDGAIGFLAVTKLEKVCG